MPHRLTHEKLFRQFTFWVESIYNVVDIYKFTLNQQSEVNLILTDEIFFGSGRAFGINK